jgi:hypothetical protein
VGLWASSKYYRVEIGFLVWATGLVGWFKIVAR